MHRSLVYWLTAQYRKTPMAMDALPASQFQAELQELEKQWQTSFNRLAKWLSVQFAERTFKQSDYALKDRFDKTLGIRVKFTMNDDMRNAYLSVQNEQVGLIRSIPQEHMTEVQGLVMRSVARGRDLHYLTTELVQRYKITQRRASFIARDQNNKATSTLQAARQQQLGITEGIWRHSRGGKQPRQSHIEADGEKFDISKGMLIDGKWIMPGELPNCRCGWQPVIPGLDD